MKLNVVKKVIAACLLLCCTAGAMSNTYATHTTETKISGGISSHQVGISVIETPNLILRPFKPSDAPYVFKNWAKNPENVSHLEWKAHGNVTTTEKLISSYINDSSNCRWCITLKGNDEPIGEIAVVSILDKYTCEVGFVLSKSHWNKGVMTEAMRSIRWYLLAESRFTRGTEFTKIIARHHIDNPASGKVLEKSGFKQIGIKKNGAKKNTGELVDSVVYETTPSYQEIIDIEF